MLAQDNEDKLRIRTLTRTDLEAVARIHRSAFPGSLSSAFGSDAVRRYYLWQLDGPHETVALAAVENNCLIGFCFGGRFSGAQAGFLRTNLAFLAFRLATRPSVLLNRQFRQKMARGLRGVLRWKRRQRTATESVLVKSFGILSIAVDPSHQGRGIGKHLMSAVETIARRSNYEQMRLTVDPGNTQAAAFYSRLGWKKDAEPGTWKGFMLKNLTT